MNHRPKRPEDRFDIWLDAYVAGTSTPASRAASDSETSEVRAAARRFHGLARGAEHSPTVTPFASTWEDFMHAQPASLSPIASSSIRRAAVPSLRGIISAPPSATSNDSSPTRTASIPPYRGARWHLALNLALAVLLIAVIGGGIWRATGGFGGSGDEQRAAFAPDTRVWTPEASEATPEPENERALLPTAEECTVEPLTVDDVLWYIDDPLGATMRRDMNGPATPDSSVASTPMEPTVAPDGFIVDGEVVQSTPDSLVASPPPVFTPGPASPEQLAAVAEIQGEWMACVLADSPFQRWALESPLLVAEQVVPLFPNFASREDARQILEGVEATGEMEPSDDFWNQPNASYRMITSKGFPTLDTIVLIDPTTADSWTLDGRTITVGYTSHHSFPNGEVIVTQTELTVMGTPIAERDTYQPGISACNSFDFTWFPDRAELLVSSIPTCG